jgi:Leucine-rich repeat (LRR) protein
LFETKIVLVNIVFFIKSKILYTLLFINSNKELRMTVTNKTCAWDFANPLADRIRKNESEKSMETDVVSFDGTPPVDAIKATALGDVAKTSISSNELVQTITKNAWSFANPLADRIRKNESEKPMETDVVSFDGIPAADGIRAGALDEVTKTNRDEEDTEIYRCDKFWRGYGIHMSKEARDLLCECQNLVDFCLCIPAVSKDMSIFEALCSSESIYDQAQAIRGWMRTDRGASLLNSVTEICLKDTFISDKGLMQESVLPSEIEHFQALQKLDISELHLNTLPSSIGNLLQLEELNVSGNNLKTLPSTICCLTKLKKLDASQNELISLPVDLDKLSQLMELNVSGNRLEILSPGICRLLQLTVLNVRDNRLGVLPSRICCLQKLTVLDVSGNKLKKLPEDIGDFSLLRYLSAHSNELDELPASISKLLRLIRLHVDNNKLKELPEGVYGLYELTHFSACGNKLTSLSNELGRLLKLQELSVSGNELSKLPPTISYLSKLQKLNVRWNSLNKLPQDIWELSELLDVDVACNKLTQFPEGIKYLHKLTELMFCHNPYKTLPDDLLGLCVENEGRDYKVTINFDNYQRSIDEMIRAYRNRIYNR